MSKRGPKSMADQLTVVKVSDERIQPDMSLLTPRQAELWSKIVDSLPASFFRPGDIPLLTSYCKAWDFYLQACAEMQTHGITLVDDRGRTYANPAHSVMVSQASALAQMAVKLRLSPSSRTSTKVAGAASDKPAGNRPWEAA